MQMSLQLPKFSLDAEIDTSGYVKKQAVGHLITKGISCSGFQRAWDDGFTGEGIIVAVIDTGIDGNHPDLKDKIITTINLTGEPLVESHGTHVAGTIAANGWLLGGAYRAKLIDIKVISRQGGNIDNIVKAIALAASSGAHIINMSLGGSGLSQSDIHRLTDVINYAWNKGTICIAAAGNDGTSVCSPDVYEYPASVDRAESVGACNVSDDLNNISLAYFSNENNQVDLSACGSNVASTIIGGKYAAYSGTSMATPHVSAMAAVLAQFIKSKYPQLGGSTFSSSLVSLLHANVIKIDSCRTKPSVLIGSKILLEHNITNTCVTSNVFTANNVFTTNNVFKANNVFMTDNIFITNNTFTNKDMHKNNNGFTEKYANISFGLGFLRYDPTKGPVTPNSNKFYNKNIFLGYVIN